MPSLQINFGRHVAWTSNFPLGLQVDRAEGPFIYLDDGRRLIDFISGIAVSSLGHRHPDVVQAVKDQVDRYMHVMVYGEMIQAPQVDLAALIGHPRILVLDEPFRALDAETRRAAETLVGNFVDRGGIVILASHHQDIVERLCRSVVDLTPR